MLHELFDTGNYEFIYAAMIGDVNLKARGRLNEDYNMVGTPSCFFDGGYSVYVGGPLDDSVYVNRIEEAGQRPVPPVDLMVRTDWLGNAQLQVLVSVGNDAPANQPPVVPDAPSGPSHASADSVVQVQSLASDPDAQELEYQFDWGDGSQSDWQGPFGDGESCLLSNTWSVEGAYDVRVRVRDPWGVTTDWSPALSVNIGGCCIGSVGNADGSADDAVTLSDLSALIDNLFISLAPLACQEEGNLDNSADGEITLGDLSAMIDHLFISLNPLPARP